MENEIEAAYQSSGNHMGWRFLYSPETVLAGADVAFIGLNPGGKAKQPAHDGFASPHGTSAYTHESWKGCAPGRSKLQLQVRALFKRLAVQPHEVLAGNIVPFRSPCIDDLVKKRECLSFGRDLWQRVITKAKPRVVVTLGNDAEKQLIEALSATNARSELIGWGNQEGRRFDFEGGSLIRLPHLSRFGIMERAESQPGLDKLFAGL